MEYDKKELVDKAIEMMKCAYAPYSDFHVGAALLTASGRVYTGCNIENASFSATMCAERTAIYKAVSDGEGDFVAIAIAGGKFGVINDICMPCGVCRQVMTEFCRDDFQVLLVDGEGNISVCTLAELLPGAFKLNTATT